MFLGTLQILVIDLGFELFSALSYAFEPPETDKGLMKVPPRKPVSAESKARLKAKNARVEASRLKGEINPETGEEAPVAYIHHIFHNFEQIFTAQWWKDKFEKPEGEVLVDAGTLSWAYLEGGVIETIGSLIASFTVLYAGRGSNGEMFGFTPYDSVQCQAAGGFISSKSPNCITSTGEIRVFLRFNTDT